MSRYDSYQKRIEKLAKAKNFIVKHKILLSSIFGAMFTFLMVFLFTKGTIIQDIELPSSIVYGSDFEVSKAAAGLFSSGTDITYEYQLEGTDEWVTTKPTTPGNYKIRAVSKNSFGGNIYGKEVSFTIETKDIIFVIEDKTVKYGEYDNINYSAYDYNPDTDKYSIKSNGLVGSDEVKNIDFVIGDVTKSQTTCVVDKDSLEIVNSDGNNVNALYNIYVETRNIEFEKRDIVIQADQMYKTYDGTPIDFNDEVSLMTRNMLAGGDHITISTYIRDIKDDLLTGNPVNAGTYFVYIDTYSIVNEKGENVSINYKVVYQFSYITINRRDITIKSASSERVYDGTPLVQHDYEQYTGGELVENHHIVYKERENDPSITDVVYVDNEVSSIENKIEFSIFDANNNDVSSNYHISYEYGTLKLLPYDFTLKPLEQEDFVYNNLAVYYSVIDGNYISQQTLFNDATLKIEANYIDENDTVSDSAKNASKYTLGIKDIIVTGDLKGNYNFIKETQTFEIFKREITIESVDQTPIIYNGKEYVYNKGSYNVISEIGLLENHGLEVGVQYYVNDEVYDKPIINAHDYQTLINEVSFTNEEMNGNYIVNYSDVKHDFSILKREISVKANDVEAVIYNKEVQDKYNRTDVVYTQDSLRILDDDKYNVNIVYKNSLDQESEPLNAGLYNIYITSIIFENEDNNNLNYQINLSTTEAGTFEIKKREVSIKSIDLEDFTYNGTVYEYDESKFVIVDGEFIDGDGVNVTPSYHENNYDSSTLSPLHAGTYSVYLEHYDYLNNTMDGNYTITLLHGENDNSQLVINPRPIELMNFDLEAKIYNGKVQDEYDNTNIIYKTDSLELVSTDSFELIGRFTLDGQTETVLPKDAGSYDFYIHNVNFVNGLSGDYDITYSENPGEFIIGKKGLEVSANNKTIHYGEDYTNIVLSYSGFVENEDETFLNSDNLVRSTNYTKYDNVGEYTITVSGYDSNNYVISYAEGVLTVEKAVNVLQNDITNYEGIYDREYHTLGYAFSNFYSETASDYPNDKEEDKTFIVYSGTDENNLATGFNGYKDDLDSAVTLYYRIEFVNYDDIIGSGTIKIDKRTLTIRPNDKTISYGDPTPQFDFSYDGLIDGDLSDSDIFDNNLTATIPYARYDDIPAAGYVDIIPSGITAKKNYVINFENGKLTINKATVTDDSKDYNKVYDGLAHSISIEVSGLLNNQTLDGLVTLNKATISYGLTENTYDLLSYDVTDVTKDGPITVYYQITFTNYNTITGSKTITIRKAPLTVTAKDKTITYGDAPSNDGVTYSGFVNNETEAVLGGTLTYSYNYSLYGDVGDYIISIDGYASDNYEINYVPGKLTVEQYELSLVWDTTTEFVYNGKVQAVTCTPANVINNDDITITVSGRKDVGEYNVANGNEGHATGIEGEKAHNYKLPTNTSIDFKITKKIIDVFYSNEDVTIVYGQIFTSTITTNYQDLYYVSFLESDTFSDQNITVENLVISSDYHRYDHVTLEDSTHSIHYYITISGTMTCNNYTFNFQRTELVVTKKPITGNATPYEGVYDGDFHTFEVNVNGLENGDTMANKVGILYSTTGLTDSYNSDVIKYKNVGEYTVYYEVLFENYVMEPTTSTIKITPATLTVKCKDITLTYGEELPAFVTKNDLIITGFVKDENINDHIENFGTSVTYSSQDYLDHNKEVGLYDLTISHTLVSVNGNYIFNYIDVSTTSGKLDVIKREITIIWDSEKDLVYNGLEQCISATAGNNVYDDVLTLTINVKESGEHKNVGAYTAQVTAINGDKASNYKLPSDVEMAYNITKAPLTITANEHTITYGDAPSNNGVIYSGFVNNETEAVLGGTLTYSYTYILYGDIGSYDINISGLTSDNYDITFVKGKLIVTQREITINWSNVDSFVYNGLEQCREAIAGNLVNNDVITLSIVVTGTHKDVGEYTATVDEILGTKKGNYKLPADTTATFTITKATLTDASTGFNVVYDGDNHYVTINLTGFVNGETFETSNGKVKYSLDHEIWTIEFTFLDTNETKNSHAFKNVPDTVGGYYYYKFDFKNYNVEYLPNHSIDDEYGSVSIAITKKQLTNNTLASKEYVYDAAYHYVVYDITGFVDGENLTNAAGVSYIYNIFGESNTTTDPLGFRDVTYNSIDYKIIFDNYQDVIGNQAIKITKAPINDLTSGDGTFTYNGLKHELTFDAGPFLGEGQLQDSWNNSGVIIKLSNDGYSYNVDQVAYDWPINAGTYTIYYQIEFKNYQTITDSKIIKIEPKELEVTPENISITYGENPRSIYPHSINLTITGFVNNEIRENVLNLTNLTFNFDSYFDNGNPKDCGDYLFRARDIANATHDNYTFNYKDATLTVNKKLLTIDRDLNENLVYDGSAKYPTLTLNGFVYNQNNNNHDFDITTTVITKDSMSFTGDPIKAGTYTANVTFDNEVKNYILPETPIEFIINKVHLEISINNITTHYTGYEYNYPSTDRNFVVDSANTAKIGHSGNDEIIISIKYLKDGQVVLSHKDVDTYYIDINNFTVTYNSDDYTDCYEIVLLGSPTLTITKLYVSIEAEMDDFTYDGMDHSYPSNTNNYKIISIKDSSNGNTLNIDDLNISSDLAFTISVLFNDNQNSIKNAGTYTMNIFGHNPTSNNLEVNYEIASVTINKKPVEISLSNQSKTYDGLAFTYPNVSDGFCGTDYVSLVVNYYPTRDGSTKDSSTPVSPINAGYYIMEVDVGATWYTFSGDLEANYTISFDGHSKLLTINKREVYIKAVDDSSTIVYDGQTHAYNNNGTKFEYYGSSKNNPDHQFLAADDAQTNLTISYLYTCDALSISNSSTDPTHAGQYKIYLMIPGSEPFRDNYEIYNEADAYGLMTISQRKVKIVANDINDKVYDGNPISAYPSSTNNFTVDLTQQGYYDMVSGEDLTIKISYTFNNLPIDEANIINAGTYFYKGEFHSLTNGVASDYDFEYETKSFEITKREVFITAKDIASFVYDHQSRTYEDFLGENEDSWSYYGDSVSDSTKQFVIPTYYSVVMNFLFKSGDLTLSSIHDANEYEIILDESNCYFAKEDASNISILDNHTITLKSYSFNITPKDLTISLKDQTSIYDGEIYSYPTYAADPTSYVVSGLCDNDNNAITSVGIICKDGENNPANPRVVGQYKFYIDVDNSHISSNYTLIVGSNAGWDLTINKREIDLKISSATTVYNNTDYPKDGLDTISYSTTLTSDNTKAGFVSTDENLYFTFGYWYFYNDGDNSKTEVVPHDAGLYIIDIRYYDSDNYLDNNYIINVIEGQLTIEQRTVTIVPYVPEESYKTYDGEYYVFGPTNGTIYTYPNDYLERGGFDVLPGHTLSFTAVFYDHYITYLNGQPYAAEDGEFVSKVVEAGTYKVKGTDFLINGEVNNNYVFKSYGFDSEQGDEAPQYVIYRRTLVINNGNFEFTYNGVNRTLLTALSVEDQTFELTDEYIENSDNLTLVKSLNYQGRIALDDPSDSKHIFKDVVITEVEGKQVVGTYVNRSFIKMMQEIEGELLDKTYNFEMVYVEGTIKVNPKEVNLNIVIPYINDADKKYDEAFNITKYFDGKNLEFEPQYFEFDSENGLCADQVMDSISNYEELSKAIFHVKLVNNEVAGYIIDDIIDYLGDISIVIKESNDPGAATVPNYNYIFNYHLTNEIVIAPVKLAFTGDKSLELEQMYDGKQKDIEFILRTYLIIDETKSDFEYDRENYSDFLNVNRDYAMYLYKYFGDISSSYTQSFMDAGEYTVSIENRGFTFYEMEKCPDFIFDYDGMTNVDFTIQKYKNTISNTWLNVVTDGDTKSYIYMGNQDPVTAYSTGFSQSTIYLGENSASFGLGLPANYDAYDVSVNAPKKNPVLNTLPLIITLTDINQNVTNVTKNFDIGIYSNKYGEFIINYDLKYTDIQAFSSDDYNPFTRSFGELIVDGTLGLVPVNQTFRYNGEIIQIFNSDYITGQLYTTFVEEGTRQLGTDYANLTFKGKIVTVAQNINDSFTVIENRHSIFMAGTFFVVLEDIHVYTPEGTELTISDDFYLTFINEVTDIDKLQLGLTDSQYENADLHYVIFNIEQRDIYIKPNDLLDVIPTQSNLTNGIKLSPNDWTYEYISISDPFYQCAYGDELQLVCNQGLTIDDIYLGQRSVKVYVDTNRTKILKTVGNQTVDVSSCYIINQDVVDNDNSTDKKTVYSFNSQKVYGKISVIKLTVAYDTCIEGETEFTYDGGYHYNNSFKILSYNEAKDYIDSSITESTYGLLGIHGVKVYSNSKPHYKVGTALNKLSFDAYDLSNNKSVGSLYKFVIRDIDSNYVTIKPCNIVIVTESHSFGGTGEGNLTWNHVDAYIADSINDLSGAQTINDAHNHHIDLNKVDWSTDAYVSLSKQEAENGCSINLDKYNKAILDQYGTNVCTNYNIVGYVFGSLSYQ